MEKTAEEIEQDTASDSEEELRDLDLIPTKGDKGKGKVGGSFQGIPDIGDVPRPTFNNLPTDLRDALTTMTDFLEQSFSSKFKTLLDQLENAKDFIAESKASWHLRPQICVFKATKWRSWPKQ